MSSFSRLRMRLGRLRQESVARLLHVLPRSWLRFFPGSSRSFGPPRRSATIDRYLARFPGEWRPVVPAARSAYPAPHTLPKDAALMARKFDGTAWPEAGVAVIPHGRVLDEHAWPVGQADTFLYEFGYLGERPICPIYLITRLRKPVHLKGTALNLGTCWASINYGHFLFDALPRLEFFLRAGFSLDQVDYVVIPRFQGPSAKKIIERLGVPAAKLLQPERGVQYEFDILYQPSYPGSSAYYRPAMVEFYRRSEFGAVTNKPHRRLYVPRRGGTRQISNEPEIATILATLGFETVDFRAISDDCAYFREAQFVIGPHGAGLANVVFCQPGATLIELLPHNHLFPFYYSAACAGGLKYWALLGRADGPEYTHDFAPPSDVNFLVDPQELKDLLTTALADHS